MKVIHMFEVKFCWLIHCLQSIRFSHLSSKKRGNIWFLHQASHSIRTPLLCLQRLCLQLVLLVTNPFIFKKIDLYALIVVFLVTLWRNATEFMAFRLVTSLTEERMHILMLIKFLSVIPLSFLLLMNNVSSSLTCSNRPSQSMTRLSTKFPHWQLKNQKSPCKVKIWQVQVILHSQMICNFML